MLKNDLIDAYNVAVGLLAGLQRLNEDPQYRSRSLSLAITELETSIFRLENAIDEFLAKDGPEEGS